MEVMVVVFRRHNLPTSMVGEGLTDHVVDFIPDSRFVIVRVHI
jgi:hypothetical protein